MILITEADVGECVNGEMKLFEKVKKAHPDLQRYEKGVGVQFKNHYNALLQYVIYAHGGDLYLHSMVINGLLLRSLDYYRGALWSLGSHNLHVFADCLRSQCETLALAHYLNEKPEYMKAAAVGKKGHKDTSLQIVNALTMIDHLEKKHSGVRQDYDFLCSYVHPNPMSLYANMRGKEEDGKRLVEWGTTSPKLGAKGVDIGLRMLVVWTDWFFGELKKMHESNAKSID